MENKLWQCPLVVQRGTYKEMPESWLGATVNYYVGVSTYEEALTKSVKVLQSVGMVFVDLVDGKVVQLDPELWWEGYVMANYPEYSDYFPNQEEVFNVVNEGLVFHGPFMGGSTNNA
ncbi:hypothetical protein [Vibrio vulnificus]|uniref:hypothetical protein n=1 Tax=Vibrio vulnificus TaxID=672 RepID=UPI000CD02B07|nr:hypothetical protein [Vibrio vulnificus]AVW98944.1 hypothetical protein BJD94_02990 [Vibrio vulnificus Env1]EGR0234715.1 hypothetical protein [Vibrio vulnificus]ELF4909404.1 hypothetical protein [Vibrio vulnificus]ELF6258798.1 hypothetical protein [Vibrio vulnificus]ELH0867329.1 hypothetical protein [Vibrio vulnificus]